MEAQQPPTDTLNDRETESPEVTVTPDEDDVADVSLTPAQRESNRLAKRPRLDHLQPGTVTDPETGDRLPLFDVGDRIIVDRCTDLLEGCPWLDTRLYIVKSIDDESGAVHCSDPEFNHHAVVSFRNPFHRIVLPPPRGNPFAAPKGRPRREEGLPKPEGKRDESSSKRTRGRPKGSKNRAADVVAADKLAQQSLRSSGRKRAPRRGRQT